MFDELDKLNNEEPIAVCQGIFAQWHYYSAITERLPQKLYEIASSYSLTYPEADYKKSLWIIFSIELGEAFIPKPKKPGKNFL